MPYLSNNHRHQRKPKAQSLREAGLFFGFSMLSIFILLSILGVATYALQASAATGTLTNYHTIEELDLEIEIPFEEAVVVEE